MQESGSSWSRWYIIHVLEHQQDDDYIDDSNDDLTGLMQDDQELEVMEQKFGLGSDHEWEI